MHKVWIFHHLWVFLAVDGSIYKSKLRQNKRRKHWVFLLQNYGNFENVFLDNFFKHKISLFFQRNKMCYSDKDVLYIKNLFLSINRLEILTFFKKDIHFWTFKIDNHGKQWNYQLPRMLKESSG